MLSTVTNGKFQPTVLMESYCKQFNLYRSFYEYFKINQLSNGMNGYKYQVVLSKNGNTCGRTSNPVNLTVYSLPIVNSPVTLVQCDDDTDGISTFNLTEKTIK
jgi:hypothetical protein